MSSSEEPPPDVPGGFDLPAAPSTPPDPGWTPPATTEPWTAPDGVVPPWPGPAEYRYPSTPAGYPYQASVAGPPPSDPSVGYAPPSYPPPNYPPPGYPYPGYATPQQPMAGRRFAPDGYGPLAPAPKRRGVGGWVLASATVIAAGAITGVMATPIGTLPTLTGPTPTRTSASPSASTTPTPAPKPDDLLKKSAIYSLTVTGACPNQRIPSSWKAFQTQVKALVDCENSAWSKSLAKTSIAFTKPKVKFYVKTTNTPCGSIDTTFPASYCSGDQTLYFSRASYQQGRYYRLSVAEFVFHEYSHHVQELAGIFEASLTLKEDEDVTERRIELQAHCMAHYRLTHSGLRFNSDDRDDIEYQLGYSADAKGHGSAKAGRYWGEAGLYGKNIGACNTWKAKASLVK